MSDTARPAGVLKVLVTGSGGQLGRSLRRVFDQERRIDAVYADIDTLDLTDKGAVEEAVAGGGYDVAVNCAAYTAVDRAEQDEEAAMLVNTTAVSNIASAARKAGIRVIHISTDYVFSGESSRPYTEVDMPSPRSVYGRTKLEGERVLMSACPDAVIIRTAWLYSEYGQNFVRTMIEKAAAGVPLRVVCDQIGSPTYAGDLAEAILAMLKHDEWHPGIYHYTDDGVASWYDLAMETLRMSGYAGHEITPVASSEYRTAAQRPFYSVLNKAKIKSTFGLSVPYWRDSLSRCVGNMDVYGS